jgi:hypothetical protein
LLVAFAGFSIASTLFGFRELLSFDETAGMVGTVAARWPASSSVRPPNNRPELLVFIHPFCSCTFATIEELSLLSARLQDATPTIDILCYRPHNSAWKPNSLWRKAQQLPGARIWWDDDGREARKFGARTSGYVMLYSPQGGLLFDGGVTGSRGHEGTNYGIEQLAVSLNTGRRASKSHHVFGCALGRLE